MPIGEQDVIEPSNCFHSTVMEKSTEFFYILKHESLSCMVKIFSTKNFNTFHHFYRIKRLLNFSLFVLRGRNGQKGN